MAIPQKLLVIGLLLLATLATGLWLGNSGKPFNSFLTTGHKFLALAWVIFTVILVHHSARQIESKAALFATIAVLGLSICVLFASCAPLSMPQHESASWLAVHRIASAFAVIATAIMARLFILSKP